MSSLRRLGQSNATISRSKSRALQFTRPRLQLPVMRGVIERRLLLSFRCEPRALAKILPPPFRPRLVAGWGVAGICLIRLGHMRPSFLPAAVGFTSENAAHRIAVEWEEDGGWRQGVYIPRRDTDSLVSRLAGGRLFPGAYHAARFRVSETHRRYELEMRSRDGAASVLVHASAAGAVSAYSVFATLPDASEFFRGGALGWSARPAAGEFDGLELRCDTWRMEPLAIEHVESSFFDNTRMFAPGTVAIDSAFLMRDIAHERHARGRLKLVERSAP